MARMIALPPCPTPRNSTASTITYPAFAGMSQTEVLRLLRAAWDEDPLSATKLVMQLGDPRPTASIRNDPSQGLRADCLKGLPCSRFYHGKQTCRDLPPDNTDPPGPELYSQIRFDHG